MIINSEDLYNKLHSVFKGLPSIKNRKIIDLGLNINANDFPKIRIIEINDSGEKIESTYEVTEDMELSFCSSIKYN